MVTVQTQQVHLYGAMWVATIRQAYLTAQHREPTDQEVADHIGWILEYRDGRWDAEKIQAYAYGVSQPVPVPTPTPSPAPVPTPAPSQPGAVRTVDIVMDPAYEGATVYLDDINGHGHRGTIDASGQCAFNDVTPLPQSYVSVAQTGFVLYTQHVDLKSGNLQIRIGVPADPNRPDDVVLPGLTPLVKALPPPPTRAEIVEDVALTFQGLIFPTKQFGDLPGFEACLPWLTPEDRQLVYTAKHHAGAMRVDGQSDTHCIITIPDGVPLYDEPNQAYSPDKFGPLDWTNGNTKIDDKLPALIREVIAAGFSKILLYLGGDGGGDAYKIAFKQLDLLYANDDYRTTLYKYCIVLPGWDGVFYGWPLEQVQPWAAKFRSYWPDGHLGLHYSTGHIPLGEGGEDFLPGGRMRDFDLLVGEYDDNLHRDSTWQILNRLERNYVRAADEPPDDDPDRRFYLREPNPRGPWGHFAMEFGEYEAVRMHDLNAMVAHVNDNRAYMKSMNVKNVG